MTQKLFKVHQGGWFKERTRYPKPGKKETRVFHAVLEEGNIKFISVPPSHSSPKIPGTLLRKFVKKDKFFHLFFTTFCHKGLTGVYLYQS